MTSWVSCSIRSTWGRTRSWPSLAGSKRGVGWTSWRATGTYSRWGTWPGPPVGRPRDSRRSSRYSAEEVASLAFDGPAPRPADLSRRWRDALEIAGSVIDRLADAHVGQAVLTPDARLFTGGTAALDEALANECLIFHPGRSGGALPQVKGYARATRRRGTGGSARYRLGSRAAGHRRRRDLRCPADTLYRPAAARPSWMVSAVSSPICSSRPRYPCSTR